MKLENNIKKFYLFKFIATLFFHTPIFIVYLQGFLSLTQIALLEISAGVVKIIFEVPSGAFADRVGRKHSMMVSTSLLVLAYYLYIIAPNYSIMFAIFFIARALTQLSHTFISGADTAFVYDTLKQVKRKDDFKKVMGNAQALGFLGNTFSALIGGFVASIDIRIPYMANIFVFAFATFIAFSFLEPRHFRKTQAFFIHQLKAFKYTWENKYARFMTFYYSIIFSFTWMVILIFLQPYFQQLGIPLVSFGLIYAFFMIFIAIVSKFAANIESRLGEKKSLVLMLFSVSFGALMMGLFTNIIGFFAILFVEFTLAYMIPVLDDYSHKHIKSDIRATSISVRNWAAGISMAILSPIFGKIADLTSVATSLIFASIVLAIISIFLIKYRKSILN